MEKEKTEKWLVFEYQAEVIVETWENVYGTTDYRTEVRWVEYAECVEGKSDEEINERIELFKNATEWGSNKKKYPNIRNIRVVLRQKD